MNSEILFRGKTADSNEWVYGYLADGDIICNWYNQDKHSWEVKASTVGQYTGLKDKNEKMIFEGDILKIYYYGKSKIFGVVRYGRCRFYIDDNYREFEDDDKAPMTQMFSRYEFEIVGNIYDNPELNTDREYCTARYNGDKPTYCKYRKTCKRYIEYTLLPKKGRGMLWLCEPIACRESGHGHYEPLNR